eukprot:1156557-Pelagomonas_calceolata.AAC.5
MQMALSISAFTIQGAVDTDAFKERLPWEQGLSVTFCPAFCSAFQSMTNCPTFQSVTFCSALQSVTSERWLRLLEVSPRDVATFLQERKACGYTIIGGCAG